MLTLSGFGTSTSRDRILALPSQHYKLAVKCFKLVGLLSTEGVGRLLLTLNARKCR